jgi:hypothetical protein
MAEETSDTLARIRKLVAMGKVLISSHGFDELFVDDISIAEAMNGLTTAVVVEDYPHYFKGPCVLTLQRDSSGHPVHVVWGIPKGRIEPAVLITAYRPDPGLWEDDFRARRSP